MPILTTIPPHVTATLDQLGPRIGNAGDQHEAMYWTGVLAGTLAAAGDLQHWQDRLTEAKGLRFAQPVPYRQAVSLIGMLPPGGTPRSTLYYACGVLAGWKDATDELPGAFVCPTCDRRVMDDDDQRVRCDDHGYRFCDRDCARDLCGDLCEKLDQWSA